MESVARYLEAAWGVTLELAPWLLIGMAVAGFMHTLIPAGFIRRHLRGRGSVLKAVALGVPLPLCSCGVIPAGLGLKKDGASDGAAIGFLTATPQTGVDSILVSASFLGLPFALFKVGSALVTGWLAGWLVDRTGPAPARVIGDAEVGPDRRPNAWDGVHHAIQMVRSIWGWLLFGVLSSALLTVALPADAFAGLAIAGGLPAYLAVLALSVPLYVCATASVPIAAALVGAGMPAGAALVFLMAGPATNVATIGAVHGTFGRRVTVIYLSTLALGSLVLGWLFERVVPAESIARHASHGGHAHHGTSWWAAASAAVLLAMIGYFAVERARARWGVRTSRPRGDEGALDAGGSSAGEAVEPMGRSFEMPVEGLTCMGCVRTLTRKLSENPAIVTIEVTLEPPRAIGRTSLTDAELTEAVAAAGFKVPDRPAPHLDAG